MVLSHPYSAKEVAQSFLYNVFKLHGFPATTTGDKDYVFVSQFWHELMTILAPNWSINSALYKLSSTNGW